MGGSYLKSLTVVKYCRFYSNNVIVVFETINDVVKKENFLEEAFVTLSSFLLN